MAGQGQSAKADTVARSVKADLATVSNDSYRIRQNFRGIRGFLLNVNVLPLNRYFIIKYNCRDTLTAKVFPT